MKPRRLRAVVSQQRSASATKAAQNRKLAMDPPRITILQINDLHGCLEPHLQLVRLSDQAVFATVGGLARIATLNRQVRGETNEPSSHSTMATLFHGTFVAVQSKGEVLAPLMNALASYFAAKSPLRVGPPWTEIGGLIYPGALRCHQGDDHELLFF